MKTPTSYTDEFTLMRQFISGEKTAFTAVYREYHRRVYLFAKRYLVNEENAEDLTADTFVKLWDRRSEFSSLEHIRAFLHTTIRNACLDLIKHETRAEKHHGIIQKLSQSGGRNFELEEIRAELMQLVYAEVEKLPANMKAIFLLSYREGLKPAEIAQRLNMPVQTVYNRKLDAIKLLKTALGNTPLLLALLLCLDHFTAGNPQHWTA